MAGGSPPQTSKVTTTTTTTTAEMCAIAFPLHPLIRPPTPTHSMNALVGPGGARRHQHHTSRVYVALGSNLGDRVGNLRKAVAALNEVCVRACVRSPVDHSTVVHTNE